MSSGAVNSTTTFLPGGTYSVTAHYEGDGTFTGSDSTPGISVTVTPEASKTLLGMVAFDANGNITNSNATNIAYGSSYILSVSVTNAAGATCNPPALSGPPCPAGPVSVTDGVNNLDGGTFTLNSFGMFEDQPIQLSAGVHHIAAVYGGDGSFKTSTSATDNVTVTQAATTTVFPPNPTTAAPGQRHADGDRRDPEQCDSELVAGTDGNLQFFEGGAALGAPVAVTGSANLSGFAQAVADV